MSTIFISLCCTDRPLEHPLAIRLNDVLASGILKESHPIYSILTDQINGIENIDDHQKVQGYSPASYLLSLMVMQAGGEKSLDFLTGAPMKGTGQRGKRPIDLDRVVLFAPRPSTVRRHFPPFPPYLQFSDEQIQAVVSSLVSPCRQMGLVLDEAEVRPNLYYFERQHQLIGLVDGPVTESNVQAAVDLNTVEDSLVKGVNVIFGVLSDGSAAFPLATLCTNKKCSGADLAKYLVEIADKLEKSTPSIKVTWISTDGGGPNPHLAEEVKKHRPDWDIVQIFVSRVCSLYICKITEKSQVRCRTSHWTSCRTTSI